MLTPKENALRMIYDEKPKYIPMTFEAFRIIGMPLAPALEAPLMQDGYDPFGVFWHVDSLGGIPDNSHFLFEDITEWKNHVKIPDLSGIDFKGIAEKELEGVDRNAQFCRTIIPLEYGKEQYLLWALKIPWLLYLRNRNVSMICWMC